MHLYGFAAGFLLDMLFGDPPGAPHPVRVMGRRIIFWEKRLMGAGEGLSPEGKRRRGRVLVTLVLAETGLVTTLLLFGAYAVARPLGVIVEAVMTYKILATRCLGVESRKVYDCLRRGDVEAAREAVSMIVGRDTASLDAEGIAKAAIETVAENTSDGSIAPLLYTAVGGPVAGMLYKAVNTMDSMMGYRNDRYIDFGKAAAKLDDAVNFLPSRISALLMITSAFLLGREFSGANAGRIYRRDRRKHASPNSAQTESVCAGALGIQLAGDAVYFGRTVKKPCIGDPDRPVEAEDIVRAGRLLDASAWMAAVLASAGIWILSGIL